MNDYSLVGFLSGELSGCETTLKEASYDEKNDEYLCEDESLDNVYDFDVYVDKLTEFREKVPASPDAIHLGFKKLYFIEFKNQRRSDIYPPGIKEKFRRGTEVLHKLLKGFKPRDNQFIFCVVYKTVSGERSYRSYIQSKGVHFGLKEINQELGNFYDQIITQDVAYYKANFRKLSC